MTQVINLILEVTPGERIPTANLYLPLEANLQRKMFGKKPENFEQLQDAWLKADWQGLKAKSVKLVDVQIDAFFDTLECPFFGVICFKEKMYPLHSNPPKYFSCGFAYEFGDWC